MEAAGNLPHTNSRNKILSAGRSLPSKRRKGSKRGRKRLKNCEEPSLIVKNVAEHSSDVEDFAGFTSSDFQISCLKAATSSYYVAEDDKLEKKLEKEYLSIEGLTCPQCNLTLSSVPHLHIHKIFCSDRSLFSLGRTTLRPEHEVLLREPSSGMLSCPWCPMLSSTMRLLKKHLSTCPDAFRVEQSLTGNEDLPCPECYVKFKDLQDLRFHMQLHYIGELKCSPCDKRFLNRSSLIDHLSDCESLKMPKCSDCNRSFRDAKSFRAHVSNCNASLRCLKCPCLTLRRDFCLEHMEEHLRQKWIEMGFSVVDGCLQMSKDTIEESSHDTNLNLCESLSTANSCLTKRKQGDIDANFKKAGNSEPPVAYIDLDTSDDDIYIIENEKSKLYKPKKPVTCCGSRSWRCFSQYNHEKNPVNRTRLLQQHSTVPSDVFTPAECPAIVNDSNDGFHLTVVNVEGAANLFNWDDCEAGCNADNENGDDAPEIIEVIDCSDSCGQSNGMSVNVGPPAVVELTSSKLHSSDSEAVSSIDTNPSTCNNMMQTSDNNAPRLKEMLTFAGAAYDTPASVNEISLKHVKTRRRKGGDKCFSIAGAKDGNTNSESVDQSCIDTVNDMDTANSADDTFSCTQGSSASSWMKKDKRPNTKKSVVTPKTNNSINNSFKSSDSVKKKELKVFSPVGEHTYALKNSFEPSAKRISKSKRAANEKNNFNWKSTTQDKTADTTSDKAKDSKYKSKQKKGNKSAGTCKTVSGKNKVNPQVDVEEGKKSPNQCDTDEITLTTSEFETSAVFENEVLLRPDKNLLPGNVNCNSNVVTETNSSLNTSFVTSSMGFLDESCSETSCIFQQTANLQDSALSFDYVPDNGLTVTVSTTNEADFAAENILMESVPGQHFVPENSEPASSPTKCGVRKSVVPQDGMLITSKLSDCGLGVENFQQPSLEDSWNANQHSVLPGSVSCGSLPLSDKPLPLSSLKTGQYLLRDGSFVLAKRKAGHEISSQVLGLIPISFNSSVPTTASTVQSVLGGSQTYILLRSALPKQVTLKNSPLPTYIVNRTKSEVSHKNILVAQSPGFIQGETTNGLSLKTSNKTKFSPTMSTPVLLSKSLKFSLPVKGTICSTSSEITTVRMQNPTVSVPSTKPLPLLLTGKGRKINNIPIQPRSHVKSTVIVCDQTNYDFKNSQTNVIVQKNFVKSGTLNSSSKLQSESKVTELNKPELPLVNPDSANCCSASVAVNKVTSQILTAGVNSALTNCAIYTGPYGSSDNSARFTDSGQATEVSYINGNNVYNSSAGAIIHEKEKIASPSTNLMLESNSVDNFGDVHNSDAGKVENNGNDFSCKHPSLHENNGCSEVSSVVDCPLIHGSSDNVAAFSVTDMQEKLKFGTTLPSGPIFQAETVPGAAPKCKKPCESTLFNGMSTNGFLLASDKENSVPSEKDVNPGSDNAPPSESSGNKDVRKKSQKSSRDGLLKVLRTTVPNFERYSVVLMESSSDEDEYGNEDVEDMPAEASPADSSALLHTITDRSTEDVSGSCKLTLNLQDEKKETCSRFLKQQLNSDDILLNISANNIESKFAQIDETPRSGQRFEVKTRNLKEMKSSCDLLFTQFASSTNFSSTPVITEPVVRGTSEKLSGEIPALQAVTMNNAKNHSASKDHNEENMVGDSTPCNEKKTSCSIDVELKMKTSQELYSSSKASVDDVFLEHDLQNYPRSSKEASGLSFSRPEEPQCNLSTELLVSHGNLTKESSTARMSSQIDRSEIIYTQPTLPVRLVPVDEPLQRIYEGSIGKSVSRRKSPVESVPLQSGDNFPHPYSQKNTNSAEKTSQQVTLFFREGLSGCQKIDNCHGNKMEMNCSSNIPVVEVGKQTYMSTELNLASSASKDHLSGPPDVSTTQFPNQFSGISLTPSLPPKFRDNFELPKFKRDLSDLGVEQPVYEKNVATFLNKSVDTDSSYSLSSSTRKEKGRRFNFFEGISICDIEQSSATNALKFSKCENPGLQNIVCVSPSSLAKEVEKTVQKPLSAEEESYRNAQDKLKYIMEADEIHTYYNSKGTALSLNCNDKSNEITSKDFIFHNDVSNNTLEGQSKRSHSLTAKTLNLANQTDHSLSLLSTENVHIPEKLFDSTKRGRVNSEKDAFSVLNAKKPCDVVQTIEEHSLHADFVSSWVGAQSNYCNSDVLKISNKLKHERKWFQSSICVFRRLMLQLNTIKRRRFGRESVGTITRFYKVKCQSCGASFDHEKQRLKHVCILKIWSEKLSQERNSPVWKGHLDEQKTPILEHKSECVSKECFEPRSLKRKQSKGFVCLDCSTCFRKFSGYKQHRVQAHKDSKDLICHVCSKEFDHIQKLAVHYSRSHPAHISSSDFSTPVCHEESAGRQNGVNTPRVLKKEAGFMKIEKGSSALKFIRRPKYNCPVCHHTFSIKAQLKFHMQQHRTSKNFTCPSCSNQFSYKNSLSIMIFNLHVKNCKSKQNDSPKIEILSNLDTSINSLNFRCSLCSENLKSKVVLCSHIFINHGSQCKNPKKKKDFNLKKTGCEITENSTPNPTLTTMQVGVHCGGTDNNSTQHTVAVAERNKQSVVDLLCPSFSKQDKGNDDSSVCVSCPKCSKMFKSMVSLSQHLHRQHGTNDKALCSLCGRKFNHALILQNHLKRMHKGKCSEPTTTKLQDFAVSENDEKPTWIVEGQTPVVSSSRQQDEMCNLFLSKRNSLGYTSVESPLCSNRLYNGNPRKPKFPCHNCGFDFKSGSALSAHDCVMQNDGFTKSSDSAKYVHDIGVKKFVGSEENEVHNSVPCTSALSEHTENVSMCFQGTENHVKTKDQDSVDHKTEFVCDDCNVSYKIYSCLKRHRIKVHRDVSKFSCTVCAQGFSYPHTLKTHMQRLHSNGTDRRCYRSSTTTEGGCYACKDFEMGCKEEDKELPCKLTHVYQNVNPEYDGLEQSGVLLTAVQSDFPPVENDLLHLSCKAETHGGEHKPAQTLPSRQDNSSWNPSLTELITLTGYLDSLRNPAIPQPAVSDEISSGLGSNEPLNTQNSTNVSVPEHFEKSSIEYLGGNSVVHCSVCGATLSSVEALQDHYSNHSTSTDLTNFF